MITLLAASLILGNVGADVPIRSLQYAVRGQIEGTFAIDHYNTDGSWTGGTTTASFSNGGSSGSASGSVQVGGGGSVSSLIRAYNVSTGTSSGRIGYEGSFNLSNPFPSDGAFASNGGIVGGGGDVTFDASAAFKMKFSHFTLIDGSRFYDVRLKNLDTNVIAQYITYSAGSIGSNPDFVDLENHYFDAGRYQLSVDISSFAGGLYYGLPYLDYTSGLDWSVTAVPEPATWAMMVMNFGAVGYVMRRRRRAHLQLAVA